MKVAFITRGSIYDLTNDDFNALVGVKVVVFSYNGVGIVNFRSEIDGLDSKLEDIARLSKALSSVVIVGADTDNLGVFKHSVVVADCGRILGVSDSVTAYLGQEFKCGYGLRAYDTTAGRLGVIVNDDIFCADIYKTFADSDADVVFAVTKRQDNFVAEMMVITGAYCNGVYGCLCFDGCALVGDISGEALIKTTERFLVTNVPINKNYRIITIKRRCNKSFVL